MPHRAQPRLTASTLGVLAAVMLVLTACVPASRPDLTEADLIGEWVYEAESGHRSVLLVGEDGTFLIDEVPRAASESTILPASQSEDFLSWSDPSSVIGTWKPDGDQMYISYRWADQEESKGRSLRYEVGPHGVPRLFKFVGDPDVRLIIRWERVTDQ